MPKLCVRKIYWINLAVSGTLAALTAKLLKPILPAPLSYPIAFFLVLFLTAYPFFRELARVAGRQYTFARHVAGALLGAAIGATVSAILDKIWK